MACFVRPASTGVLDMTPDQLEVENPVPCGEPQLHFLQPLSSVRHVEAIQKNLQRALDALELILAADALLKSGNETALYALGFSEAHVAELLSRHDGVQHGYPAYALRNAHCQVNWLRKRLAKAQREAGP